MIEISRTAMGTITIMIYFFGIWCGYYFYEPTIGLVGPGVVVNQPIEQVQTEIKLPYTVVVVREIPPWQPRALQAIHTLDPNVNFDWAVELSDQIGMEFYRREIEDVDDPVMLGIALCYVESSFNKLAQGPWISTDSDYPVRCEGLFQIHPLHDIDNIFDMKVNMKAGADILDRYCLQRGSLKGGLNRYGTDTSRVIRIYRQLLELDDVQN